VRALDVLLGVELVGLLEQTGDWEYRFSFDSSWLGNPARPTLGQLFEDRKPRDIETTGHVPIWFSHLLPQGPLRRAICRRAEIDDDDELSLLELLGSDLPGAVILKRGTPRLETPLTARRDETVPPIEPTLRFSLAGNQWKLSVHAGERGVTMPLPGESGGWIAKFHDPTFRDLPRVEHATMTWARESGVTLPEFRLAAAADFPDVPNGIPMGDGTFFLIRRFDRGESRGRTHMEDFAQVLDRPAGEPQYEGAHEHLATVLASLVRDDLEELCRRIVFCVLCGNTDGHLKNWSLVYPDRRHARLSPAYDLVASVLYVPAIKDELALSLGGTRLFEAITVDSFQLFANVSGLSFTQVADWVGASAYQVRRAWNNHAAELGFTSDERIRLEKHLARVRL
jgi:serine/threonine-protein kinase HipA